MMLIETFTEWDQSSNMGFSRPSQLANTNAEEDLQACWTFQTDTIWQPSFRVSNSSTIEINRRTFPPISWPMTMSFSIILPPLSVRHSTCNGPNRWVLDNKPIRKRYVHVQVPVHFRFYFGSLITLSKSMFECSIEDVMVYVQLGFVSDFDDIMYINEVDYLCRMTEVHWQLILLLVSINL